MARMIFGNFLLFYSETFHYFNRKLFTILMAIIYFLTLSHIDNGVNQAELAV